MVSWRRARASLPGWCVTGSCPPTAGHGAGRATPSRRWCCTPCRSRSSWCGRWACTARGETVAVSEAAQVVKASLVSVVIIWSIAYLFDLSVFSVPFTKPVSWMGIEFDAGRVQFATLAVALPLMMALHRVSFRAVLRVLRRRGWNQRHVAVIGTGRRARSPPARCSATVGRASASPTSCPTWTSAREIAASTAPCSAASMISKRCSRPTSLMRCTSHCRPSAPTT